jgi:hypothetical protein
VVCLVATIALLVQAQSAQDPALSSESAESTALLERWGRLHQVRATFAIGGFVLLALA